MQAASFHFGNRPFHAILAALHSRSRDEFLNVGRQMLQERIAPQRIEFPKISSLKSSGGVPSSIMKTRACAFFNANASCFQDRRFPLPVSVDKKIDPGENSIPIDSKQRKFRSCRSASMESH